MAKGVVLRGDIWWVWYRWKGEWVRFSTNQKDKQKAIDAYNIDRGERLQGRLGIVDRQKEDDAIPTLAEYLKNRYIPYARALWEKAKPKTWEDWMRPSINALLAFPQVADKKINQLTSEDIIAFRSFRQSCGLKPASVNRALSAFRLLLQHAEDVGLIKARPSFRKKMLPGEEHRERVVTKRDELRYLTVAPELVGHVATLMVDSGLRPEEAYRLRWENVYWDRGKRGEFLTKFGKSKAAHRILSLTQRTRDILVDRYHAAGKPTKGFIFPAETDTGHINESSLKRQHAAAFDTITEQTPKEPVERFVLYSLRHTFLTRLATTRLPDGSKVDVWTFMRIAGHASISMSLRYVHPDQSLITTAMESLADTTDHKTITVENQSALTN